MSAVVKHRADSTEEFGVDKISQLLPSKVFIVEIIIAVQDVEELCQVLRAVETVDMNEGFGRSYSLVVLDGRPHHDGKNIILESIEPELLSDVVHTVGVLKCQIELVLSQFIAALRAVSRTEFSSAVTEHINPDVLAELLRVLQPVVPGVAVADEPGNLAGFVLGKVSSLRRAPGFRVELFGPESSRYCALIG